MPFLKMFYSEVLKYLEISPIDSAWSPITTFARSLVNSQGGPMEDAPGLRDSCPCPAVDQYDQNTERNHVFDPVIEQIGDREARVTADFF